MAWTTPMTAVANTAFTAAQFNAHVRDNLNETAPAKAVSAGGYIVTTGPNQVTQRGIAQNLVATSETTTSTSYTDLATVGPAVSAAHDGIVLVHLTANYANNTIGNAAYMSFDISGGALSASDANAGKFKPYVAGADGRFTTTVAVSGLTPGTNTFTAKYRVDGNTGTFKDRVLIVMPF